MKDLYRILIVDDNPSIHDDYKKILIPKQGADFEKMEAELFGNSKTESLINYAIDSAYQGQEALTMVEKAIAENKPYAVAFVDMLMPPGWNGVETITHLWEKDPLLNIVICTAYADHSWNELAEKLGINDKFLILKKPFENIEVRQMACCLSKKWELSQQAGNKYDRLYEEIMTEGEKLKKMFDKQSK